VTPNTPQEPQSSGTVSCDGFISVAGNPSQFSAQQYYDFNATPEEQAILDPDGDGIACEGLVQGEQEGVATSDTAPMVAADQYADDSEEVTNLPDTGGFPLGGVAAGLGVALVASGLLLKRRLS
jgi:hypothetical protein